ncbi:Cell cycle checkpoint protein rad17 [Apophysomyces sp. BC1034]|nr:Cell cycle checkpoint protein rad17 [Apophysomyces sp. BC1015]KAG0180813.1 Cell cycle checkpoint protein rad17 [Apophysomyces sp. BC1021]KAG0192460.1 Cell cycle checkpoint protein rad17 [Apophysomyces sp. BC1034]
MLVLTGPAGSGKSTVIRTLARSSDYELVEWTNDVRDDFRETNYQSNISKFEEFLLRSTAMPTFAIDAEQTRKKIILIDDLPDITTDDTKSRFQALLRTCLTENSSVPSLLVLVFSDVWTDPTSLRGRGAEIQLSSIRDFIPRDILHSPQCGLVEFKPATKTSIVKMLRRIADSESARPGNTSVSAEKIATVADLCHGDIRCAINALQFELLDPRLQLPQKRERGGSAVTREGFIQKTYDLMDMKFVIFSTDLLGDPCGNLESPPEVILPVLPVDSNLFLAYLHENCPKFCDNISDYAQFMENFAAGEHISSMGDWREDVRLDYQNLVSMRGIMGTQPKPATGQKIEMNKPAFFSAQKYLEENTYNNTFMTSFVADIQRKTAAGDPLTATDLGTLSTLPMALASTRVDKHQTQTENSCQLDDAIEEFSDEEFDRIFGDGSDLADLPW